MAAKIHWILLTALALLTAGCSFERNIKLDARLPLPPAFKQMPLNIRVYYSPEFVGYTKKIELIGCGPNGRKDKTGIFFIFPIGTSSRDLFDQIIESMFTSVTRTSGASLSFSNTQSIDGLLELRIESFDWETECTRDYLSTGRFLARVSYVINLYDSPDGRLLSSIRVEGQGTEDPRLCLKDCKDSIAAEQAIQDAMAKFMTDFQKQPEVRAWLSSHASMPGYHQ
jgi:hypothetical protein